MKGGLGSGFGGVLIRVGVFGRVCVGVLMVGAAFCCSSVSVAEPPRGADASTTRHGPASMSAKEYDAMLEDIAETVVQRLRGAPGQAAVQPSAQTGASADMAKQGQASDAFNGIGQLMDRASGVLRSLPKLGKSLEEVVWRL